eukprot:9241589-Ditylum_brightwellii.AAC.1
MKKRGQWCYTSYFMSKVAEVESGIEADIGIAMSKKSDVDHVQPFFNPKLIQLTSAMTLGKVLIDTHGADSNSVSSFSYPPGSPILADEDESN